MLSVRDTVTITQKDISHECRFAMKGWRGEERMHLTLNKFKSKTADWPDTQCINQFSAIHPVSAFEWETLNLSKNANKKINQ